MRDRAAALTGDFWRRVIILLAILPYVWMTVMSYSFIGAEAEVREPVDPTIFTVWTLLMVFVEILSVLVIAGMFAALALPELGLNDDTASANRTLTNELTICFALGCALHVLYTAWWFLFALFTGSIFAWFSKGLTESPVDQPFIFNGGYHLLFAAIHLTLFIWWRRTVRGADYSVSAGRYDWTGTIAYSTVLTTVYVSRFSHYLMNLPTLSGDAP